MIGTILIAGVGNVFLGDDGFGVEVARRLRFRSLPREVRVADFGIRGVHLAFELLTPIDLLLVADAVPLGDPPGTLTVIEPEAARERGAISGVHGMDLCAALDAVQTMGGTIPRTLILGCEPETVDEHMGLSPSVENAIEPAITLLLEIVERERTKESNR